MTQSSRRKAAQPARNGHAVEPAGNGGRRIQVRRSGVHGKGVFALLPIPKGETIIEYTREIIGWPRNANEWKSAFSELRPSAGCANRSHVAYA